MRRRSSLIPIFQLIVAIALSVTLAILLSRAPRIITTVLMAFLLTIVLFYGMAIVTALWTNRRQRGARGGFGGPRRPIDPPGPGLAGVREPRRPLPTAPPPRQSADPLP